MPLTHKEAETLVEAIRAMVAAPAPVKIDGGRRGGKTDEQENGKRDRALLPPGEVTYVPNKLGGLDADTLEIIYREFKNRLLEDLRHDPVFLQLVERRPEIVIELEPQIVTLDGSSLRGRVARLLAGGWFKETRATSATRRELARTGADPGGGGTLSDVLSEFVRTGFLTRDGDRGYLAAPDVKISEKRIEK